MIWVLYFSLVTRCNDLYAQHFCVHYTQQYTVHFVRESLFGPQMQMTQQKDKTTEKFSAEDLEEAI